MYNSLHDLTRVLHTHLSQSFPDDVTLLVLSDLHITLGVLIRAEKVYKVLVVYFYKGSLDVVLPGRASFLLEFTALLKYARDSSGNNTHAIIRVGGVRVEVNARHSEGFAAARLAIRKDGAVETVNEARDERLRRRGKELVLGGSRRVHLVEREHLLLAGGGGRWRSGSGAGTDGRRSGRRGIDGDAGRGYGINDCSLKASGNGGRVLVGRGSDTEGCWTRFSTDAFAYHASNRTLTHLDRGRRTR